MKKRRLFLSLSTALVLATASRLAADDWPQWRGPERDGVWRETGIVETLPEKPAYVWRTPIGGGFAGPAVAGGRVFGCDRVLPPDAAESVNEWNVTAPVEGAERAFCLDEKTGKLLWQHVYSCRYQISYPSGPRATRQSGTARSTPSARWAICFVSPPPMARCSGPRTTSAISAR